MQQAQMKRGRDKELERRTGHIEDWKKDIQDIFPGIGKGKTIRGKEANSKILKKMEEEWEKFE